MSSPNNNEKSPIPLIFGPISLGHTSLKFTLFSIGYWNSKAHKEKVTKPNAQPSGSFNKKPSNSFKKKKNTSNEFLSKDPILFKPKTNNALLNYLHYLDPFFIRCACMFALNYELILSLLITLKILMFFFA